MKLDVMRFGFAMALIWGGIVFLTGLANLIWPAYAVEFLRIVDSIYPGYHLGQWGFGGIIVGTLYGLIDGFIIGVVFAWLYNIFIKGKRT